MNNLFMTYFSKTIDVSHSPHAGLIKTGILGGFAGLIGIFFYVIYRQKKAMAAVATKYGWQALKLDDKTLGKYVPAYLNSQESTGHKYQMAYKAKVEGQDIIFFRYDNQVRVHTLSDQAARDTISHAVAAFELPQDFGPMLILHHSRVDNIGLHQGLEKFKLEGNFSKYFDVYAPSGSSVETLSLLTPDIMVFLIDFGREWRCDIQVSGHSINIACDSNLISASKVSKLLDYAALLRKKLAAKPV